MLYPARSLSVFAFDPSVAGAIANKRIRSLTISLPWEMESLDENVPFVGPRGKYVEVIDFDPACGLFYDPVNLNDPKHLRTNGLSPAVDDPKFHQQMVYAVAMNTIKVFEQALGRVALWAPRRWNPKSPQDTGDNKGFVQRLRIYPHALREANAYYDPDKKALLFGYFQAGPENRDLLPGSTIFTCLSHDIIVHETCHALLDGMHPYFAEPSNDDVLALHEAFSDIVAILLHFSHPEVLEDQIAKTRGNLEQQSLLGALAQEFGEALGRGHALRDALGEMVDGQWQPRKPDNRSLNGTTQPHARGSILVAAVFRTFVNIYKDRVADLLRIATGGRGILPEGDLDPDLRRRLAREAAKSARHLLQMCIRALDYCPPVDVTFGDYFRALITADVDMYPEDSFGYRAALIEAFTAWGIRPEGMQIVTENTLQWPTLAKAAEEGQKQKPETFPEEFGSLLNDPKGHKDDIKRAASAPGSRGDAMTKVLDGLAEEIIDAMEIKIEAHQRERLKKETGALEDYVLSRNLLDQGLTADRKVEHLARHLYGELFWYMLHEQQNEALYDLIGVDLGDTAPKSINRSKFTGRPALQVHSVRMAKRVGDRGQVEREYVVGVVQSRSGYLDPDDQAEADRNGITKPRDFSVRSGATLLIDARTFEIRRIISTSGKVTDKDVMDRHRANWQRRRRVPTTAFDGLSNAESPATAFAALHRSAPGRTG